MIKKIRKAIRIVSHRIRSQGIWTTFLWAYARGMPMLTGVPPLRFSRVTPEIYVGPQYGKLALGMMKKQGIDTGVNLRVEFDDAEHGLALPHYLHLPTVDETPPTLEHLQQAADFIADRVADGGRVYIHCAGGVGRAPSTAAAYFITQGLSLDEAIVLIKKGRPFIDILPPQMERLDEFEQHWQSQYD